MPPNPFEALASRWVPGVGPVHVEPMATGLTNDSFRVDRDGRRYVLRVATGTSPELGQDRQWEYRVLDCAAKAGLAPAIERCEVTEGVLISDWVECRAWTPDELALPANVKAMARLLWRVHGLRVAEPTRVMDPSAWIRHYTAALVLRHGPEISCRSRALQGLVDLRLAEAARGGPAQSVLCHSDLHRFNVAVRTGASAGAGAGEELLLLDWEYAHVADPYWDLAGWAANNDWPAATATGWLAAYLGRPAASEEIARLSVWRWLYDYVCLLWSELYLTRSPDEATRGVEERVETLCARLTSRPGSRAGEVPAH